MSGSMTSQRCSNKMKVLVLNGSKAEKDPADSLCGFVADFLVDHACEVDVMTLRKEKIANCMSCFGCWLKTPGECVINDAGRELARKVIQSDVLLLLTPVTFGMYSSELKRALDRFTCPILMPFLEMVKGEVHHAKRYDKYPFLIAIGVLPCPDEESESSFATLVARNSINFHTTAASSIVYSTDSADAVKEKVALTLTKAGVN